MLLITALLVTIGVHYFYSIKSSDTFFWKIIKNLIAFCAIIGSVMTGIQVVEAWYYPEEKVSFESTWYTNYEEALHDAKEQHKLIFIDAWTPYCSVCKGITNKILKSDIVSTVLKDHYIILSVDASDATKEPYKTVRAKYKVTGVPYLIVLDPETETEITHWQSEMYEMTIEEVRKVLADLSLTSTDNDTTQTETSN